MIQHINHKPIVSHMCCSAHVLHNHSYKQSNEKTVTLHRVHYNIKKQCWKKLYSFPILLFSFSLPSHKVPFNRIHLDRRSRQEQSRLVKWHNLDRYKYPISPFETHFNSIPNLLGGLVPVKCSYALVATSLISPKSKVWAIEAMRGQM